MKRNDYFLILLKINTNLPITSGVFALCKCSVFKCNCNEGRANITSLVCECSCNLPEAVDVLLPRTGFALSEVLSVLSRSTHGNRSTAVNKLSKIKFNQLNTILM